MTQELNTFSLSTLEDLQAQVEANHRAFSEAHYRRTDAEASLTVVAGKRAAILKVLKAAQRALPVLTQSMINTCVEDPGKADGTALLAARHRVTLLKQSLASLSVYSFADAERAVIEAKITELSAQLTLETLRAEHQEMRTALAVASIDSQSGGLTLENFGATAAAMRANLESITKQLRDLRTELRNHDAATTQARGEYEKEFTQHA